MAHHTKEMARDLKYKPHGYLRLLSEYTFNTANI